MYWGDFMPLKDSVFSYFEKISAIPRGSGNTEQISKFCVDFAKEHGLKYTCDSVGNVVIFSPATAGYESSSTVMIQGHLDMVCESTAESVHNFLKDGVELCNDGEYIFAKGTTLGADDGIAVALALAVLSDEELEHPPLEVVLTVDEEIGMLGATKLDCSALKSSYLLNLDSEEEGVFLVGCAGGFRCDCEFRLPVVANTKNGYHIEISGLTGGHSGTDIDKGRINASMLLGKLLSYLNAVTVGNFRSGTKDNVIPTSASADFSCFHDLDGVRTLVEIYTEKLKEIENDIIIAVSTTDVRVNCDYRVFKRIFDRLPYGVISMSEENGGMVETSANLGITCLDGDILKLGFCARSAVKSGIEQLKDTFFNLSAKFGGEFKFYGEYAPWEYKKESELRPIVAKVFKEVYGYDVKFETIHAGVECGVIGSKMPSIDALSFGPEILDIHTPRERMNIKSVEKMCEFLEELLKRLK